MPHPALKTYLLYNLLGLWSFDSACHGHSMGIAIPMRTAIPENSREEETACTDGLCPCVFLGRLPPEATRDPQKVPENLVRMCNDMSVG